MFDAIIVAVVVCYDRYYGYIMVEASDGSFHDVDRWFWDERTFYGEVDFLVGMTVGAANSYFHEQEVRRIRSWV